MTDQIGCLVNASPCSIGYAGRGATNNNPNTGAIKFNGQGPIAQCITGDGLNIAPFTYPFSRKLYLDSIVGFGNVTENEQSLVGCETDLAQTKPPLQSESVGGIVASAIVSTGYLQIPSYYNGGHPFCEDFNETMLCGAATYPVNSASCPTALPAAYSAFPTTNSTTCGNGLQEEFEDCDCGFPPIVATAPPANVTACAGTFNGGNFCTTACRTPSGPVGPPVP